MQGRASGWRSRLAAPIPASSLAAFRIAFGLLMAWEAWRFLRAGWIEAHWVEPAFHFRYFGFEWVEPLPLRALQGVVAAIGACGVTIALGVATRAAAALLFVLFGYTFLLEQARYLNHFWLVLLLAALLAWVPTDGAFSVRSRRRGRRDAPWYALALLRAQLLIVYGYAALAKLNGDWLQGEPLRQWLKSRAELPLVGPLLAAPLAPWVMSYAGLALDLLAVPFLLWQRTRAAMFGALCAFHVANAFLFDIGIFPWLAIGATTLFFAPDWPDRLCAWWRGKAAPERTAPPDAPAQGARPVAWPTACAIVAWLAFQLLVPLRHLLYPGPVSWTEEGHRFAWHMKLRSKSSMAHFVVTDPLTGARRLVDPRGELEEWQARKMGDRPDMVLQYAHHLAERFAVVDPASGERRRPQVRAIVECSLNGRDPQELIDPEADLAAIPRSLAPAAWIVPLREPLPPQWRRGNVEFDG